MNLTITRPEVIALIGLGKTKTFAYQKNRGLNRSIHFCRPQPVRSFFSVEVRGSPTWLPTGAGIRLGKTCDLDLVGSA